MLEGEFVKRLIEIEKEQAITKTRVEDLTQRQTMQERDISEIKSDLGTLKTDNKTLMTKVDQIYQKVADEKMERKETVKTVISLIGIATPVVVLLLSIFNVI